MSNLILPETMKEPEVEPQNCTTCRLYKMTNVMAPKMGGGCRANPPQVVLVGQQQDKLGRVTPLTMSFWPSVGETDWCARYLPGFNTNLDS